MAKKKVKFKYTDGRKVTRGPGGAFNLRSPVGLVLPPKNDVPVKLGLTADKTLVVVPSANAQARGLQVKSDNFFIEGQEIVVSVRNTTALPLPVESGDVLALAYVLDNTDFEAEE